MAPVRHEGLGADLGTAAAAGQTVRYLKTFTAMQPLFTERGGLFCGRAKWRKRGMVGVAARRAPGAVARLVAVATRREVFVFDARGDPGLAAHLQPFFADEAVTKVAHALTEGSLAEFAASAKACDMRRPLAAVVDLQLVAEMHRDADAAAGLFDSARALNDSVFPERPATEVARFGSVRPEALADKALDPAVVEAVASDAAWLQLVGDMILSRMQIVLRKYQQGCEWRAAFAVAHPGSRAVAIARAPGGGYRLRSREAHMPDPAKVNPETLLTVECDVEDLVGVIPEDLGSSFGHDTASEMVMQTLEGTSGDGVRKDGMVSLDRLNDIVLDVGRTPNVWIGGKRYSFGRPGRRVMQDDLDYIVRNVGEFGSDNRAGLEGQLHRVSCMRHRADDRVIGLTMRIGRCVTGNVSMIMDLLRGTRKSILFVGPPCTGKTTIVREAARVLAEEQNVCVVDTSNEISGDGAIPHGCIGQARRMMVPSLNQQWAVMVECVQNHSVDTMLVDEIGRAREVEAARTVKQRGVRLLASAHGDLRGLVKNKELHGLIGGVVNVTVSDEAARDIMRKRARHTKTADKTSRFSKTFAQRAGEPTFDIIIEVSGSNLHEWNVVLDAAQAVDLILEGGLYPVQTRARDVNGDNIRVRERSV